MWRDFYIRNIKRGKRKEGDGILGTGAEEERERQREKQTHTHTDSR